MMSFCAVSTLSILKAFCISFRCDQQEAQCTRSCNTNLAACDSLCPHPTKPGVDKCRQNCDKTNKSCIKDCDQTRKGCDKPKGRKLLAHA